MADPFNSAVNLDFDRTEIHIQPVETIDISAPAIVPNVSPPSQPSTIILGSYAGFGLPTTASFQVPSYVDAQSVGAPSAMATQGYFPTATHNGVNDSFYVTQDQLTSSLVPYLSSVRLQTGQNISSFTLSVIPGNTVNLSSQNLSYNQSTLTLSPFGSSVQIVNGIDWAQYESQNGEIYLRDPVSGQIDTIHTEDNNLYYNNILIANESNISSIADWSLYPALSTIEADSNDIHQVRNLDAQTISSATNYLNNVISFSTLTSTLITQTVKAFYANVNTEAVSTLNVRYEINMTDLADESQHSLVSLTPPGQSNFLVYDNQALATQQFVSTSIGPVSQNIANWANYPAVHAITASNNLVLNPTNSVLVNSSAVLYTIGSISGGNYTVNVDGGVNYLDSPSISLTTSNGAFGRIDLNAYGSEGLAPIEQGGLINMVAHSAPGTTPAALSRLNGEAATVTLSAGALGSLAYVPGSVNLLSGLGTGIQLLTATGVINIASGQALTLSAAQAVAINGGANGVRFTNTSGSKLQTDYVNTYESNYTSIQAIDNQNMSPSTLTYIASTINAASTTNWSYYKALNSVNMGLKNITSTNNITANYLYIQGDADITGTVSANSGTFGGGIKGAGPSFPITNSGYICLNTSNAVYINKLPSVSTEADGDLKSGTLACTAGITANGNISSSNAIVGQIGAFSKIDSVSTIEFQGGASINRNGTDLTILGSVSTQNLYSQVNLTTDGAVEANTVFADSFVSTAVVNTSTINANTANFNTVSTQALLVSSINGVPPGLMSRIGLNTPQTIPTTATNNTVTDAVTFSNEVFDFIGAFTGPASTITLAQLGYYRIFGSCAFANNGQGQRNIAIYTLAGGGANLDLNSYPPTGTGHGQVTCDIEGTYLLGPNAQIQLRVGQTSGGNLALNSARMEIQRVR